MTARPTSAALRERHLREHVVPQAELVFDAYPRVASVLWVVGQFAAADAFAAGDPDEVHAFRYLCDTKTPAYPDCMFLAKNRYAPIGSHPGNWAYAKEHGLLRDDGETLMKLAAVCRPTHATRLSPAELRVAYASYCAGPPRGDEDPWRAYCVVRRTRSAPRVDVVGTMLRPALEDVWPA